MEQDVREMICRARRHEPEAVDQLLSAYRNYLRVLAQLWLNPNLPAKVDPSDLVQDTLLKAHQNFADFRGENEGDLTAWLRKILSRCVVDVVRKYQASSRQVTREQSLDQAIDSSVDAFQNLLSQSGSSPSRQAERRELGVILADALAELSDSHRQVIVLRSLKELPWNEVAPRMNRSISTVRMLWVRALSNLRTKLEGVL